MSLNLIEYKPGTKISEPGAYIGMPLAVYHSQCCVGPSVSSSGLRQLFLESSAHFWAHSSLNPNRVEVEETKFIILGRAAHHLFGGEPGFNRHFVVRPATYTDSKGEDKPWTRQSKTCKEWEAKAQLVGLSILTPEQAEQIRGMARAIEAEPMARGMLRGHIEVSLFWQDIETGIWLKARPDVMPLQSADGADLKCVSGISDKEIHSMIEGRGYFMQGALVGEAFQNVFGVEMQSFSFVFVESDIPHCVRVESLAAEDYDLGWKANRIALKRLRRCLDTQQWPGPRNRDGQGGHFPLSGYARERIGRRIEQLEKEIAA